MCIHQNVPEYGITTEASTADTNSTISDGKSYDFEMDIRSGYHVIMSRNSTYDNVSNQRIVRPSSDWRGTRSVQITYRESTFICFSDECI
jgi:hypothetical protein